ncbi:penicillin-binding transpeptidase domain-containing protein [Butyrivibrio fibrisolvens]|uniref:peptidoglycan D,D-transpeptidase FtsI family protein n=1 Tax=Pseudobutyrivibrio ruminis TaxID=46206 RepID=UPI0009DBF3E5|nr:penicillin-binding transpeptidase domain-containing protein [Pseudobutyrivibrio ruminis]MDC7278399.1 penicillin-binding transpeptidase domain-containing protein [Butyrivibrio fibrisolvens]
MIYGFQRKAEEDMTNNHNKKSIRKEIYVTAVIFGILFVGMISYFVRFLVVDANSFIYNSYNSRFSVFADDVERGSIYTADGRAIAKTTKDEEGKEVRVYPDERLFSHAVGYVGHGMAGLEAYYSFDLLKSHITLSDQINNSLTGKKSMGDSLYTTLDYDAQKAAYDGLGMFDGAVIAIDPDTGKVIAMVSKPDYNPNTIDKYWDDINDSEKGDSALLNRATNGSYPPGSTFKIVTTLAYLRDGYDPSDFSYKCNGKFDVDDYTIHCSSNKSHGQEDLLQAFSNSCNSAYAAMGVEIDRGKFQSTAEALLFNDTLPTMINGTKASKFSINSDTKESIVAQTAIGQGKTTVSPLHMCMLVSAIANNGQLMEPYIVDRIISDDGEVVSETEPVSYGPLITSREADLLNEYMEAVVTDGTAEKVDFGDLKVYGKTGTAEYTENKKITHSWFVGYAKDENGKKLAIAVIMEGAGYGSKYAAPLAASVFDAYFGK